MTLIWGSTFLAIRVSNQEGYDPFAAALVRLLVAAGFLLALGAAMRIAWPRGRALALAVLAGNLIFGANWLLLYWGELTVPSSLAAVTWGVYPALVAIGAAAVLEGEPLTARGLGGATVAAVGLVVVFWSHLQLEGPPAGVAAILAGILLATVGSLAVKKWARDIHPVALNAFGLVGSVPMVALVAWSARPRAVLPPDAAAAAALLYLAIVGTSAFVLWAWLLQRWPATRVSFQTVLSPLVAVVLGVAILGEPLGAGFLAGTALVLGGTWLAVRAPRPHPAPGGAGQP
jgi:drug/metabolite transporter (DMT)-like permease